MGPRPRWSSLRWNQGEFSIDILARLGDAFAYDDIEIEVHTIEGIDIPVATPRALYAMKKGTLRPQDLADAQRLKERFGLEDR